MECQFSGSGLFNLTLRLILNKTNQEEDVFKRKNVSSAITLGTYAAKMNQLRLLSEILWRNSISLTRKPYDLINSDLATLKFYLHLYMSAIYKANARDLIALAVKKQRICALVDVECKLQADYFRPLEELCRAYDKINAIGEIDAIDEENVEEESILHRGRTWMLLGYVQLSLFGNLDVIDPVHKFELKLKYLEEDIADCKRTMYIAMLQNRISGTSEDECAHGKLAAMRNCARRLSKERDDLGRLRAFRPPSANFTVLSEECASFRNEVASYELVQKHAHDLCTIARKIRQNSKSVSLTIAEYTAQKSENWCLSIQRFAEHIEAEYSSVYPDVIIPVLTALTQLKHGVCILIDELRRLALERQLKRENNLESSLYNFLRFPTIGQRQDNLLTLSNLCASASARELMISGFSGDLANAEFVRTREQFRIFKSGLHEARNHVILNRGLTKSQWWNVNELLRQIFLIWKQQQQQKEEKRAVARNSSLENKIEDHWSTEENELALIDEMFPTYRENDLDDTANNATSRANENDASADSSKTEARNLGIDDIITRDDISELQQIHSSIVASFTAFKWMCNSPVSICPADYAEPLTQRYNTIHGMLDDTLSSFSEGFANGLHNSLCLLITLELRANRANQTLREDTDRRTTRKPYDFYHDRNIDEAKQCLPVCQGISDLVDKLLMEWPENPILRSIRCTIERIHAFPIVSPVSRFLTGLELLLEKMYQWDRFARSPSVRMKEHALALKDQIISWRNLELSCWRTCLDATYENLRSDTSEWWFVLYASIESYVTERRFAVNDTATANDEPEREKFVRSLERFMTESPLVEFEARLNLLLTFHCHVNYLDDNDGKDELSAILWNVHGYYRQFVDVVNARIANLKAPVERKLRNVVRNVRWTSVDYWTTRKSVQATHRQLYRCVKEYRSALKGSVSTCLMVRPEVPRSVRTSNDAPSFHRDSHDAVTPDDFIVTGSVRSAETEIHFCDLIARTGQLLTRAKKLCKEIILVNPYPSVRSELERLVERFMERSARVRDMSIDKNLPRGRQKSQARSILQEKRTTLADYFDTLTRIGVSHHTGGSRNNAGKATDFTAPPLDLSTMDRLIVDPTNADRRMLEQWQGCEDYYYKSLVRLNALDAMLGARDHRSDLDPRDAERCRGYSAHLMLMADRQKTTIARSFDRFLSLRVQLANLSEARNRDVMMSRQREDCARNLKTLLTTMEAGFEQLLLFLQCCPADNETSSTDKNRAVLTSYANTPPIVVASRNDATWENANALLKDGLNSIRAIAKRFHALFVPFEVLSWADRADRAPAILSSRHFEFLQVSCTAIADLRVLCEKLKRVFTSADVAHPIWESVAFLDAEMERFLRDFEHLRGAAQVDNEKTITKEIGNASTEWYEEKMEDLMSTVLLVVQKKYKSRLDTSDDAARTNEDLKEENNEDAEKQMKKDALKGKLIDSLEKDMTELQLSKVSDLFFKLLRSIQSIADLQSADHCTR